MRRGGEEHRVLEPGAGPRRQRPIPARPAIPCPPPVADVAFAGEGLGHHAEGRPSTALQPDQRPPHRQTRDEGARPVDRVEHPDVLGVEPLGAVFLAENAVVGMVGADQRPHRRLRRPVRHRHRVEGGPAQLVLHRQPRPEMRQDRRPGRVGEPIEKGDEVLGGAEFGHDGRSSAVAGSPQAMRRAPPQCKPDRAASTSHRRIAVNLDQSRIKRAFRPLTLLQRNIIFIASRSVASRRIVCPSRAFPP